MRKSNKQFYLSFLRKYLLGFAHHCLYLMSTVLLCVSSLFIIVAAAGANDKQQLVAKASSAYNTGEYQKCIDYYTAVINLGMTSSDVFYNMACCCALNGNNELALDYIEQAIESGYFNSDWLKKDSDLQSLRENSRWPDLVLKCEAANEAYLQSINRELYLTYREDQGDRKSGGDWSNIIQRDAERRELVYEMLDSGLVKASDDYFHAAMIFQHGVDSSDYSLAHELALKAVALDTTNAIAKWLAAASKDRYLLNIGQSQIYGTQLRLIDEKWTIEPIDTTVITDEERQKWQVPPLSEAKLKAVRMNEAEKR
ncbi:MAG: hypothetical protein KAR42_02950 [candidate division Zixibacteria bacterium]|nr:hypothetical protein [candidate division Zixibacteria bacterium]